MTFNMTEEDKKFMISFGREPKLRKLLSSDEITVCNELVKKGLMMKGRADDSLGSVIYCIYSSVYSTL